MYTDFVCQGAIWMKFATGIALGVLASAGWAQNDSELTPRELFYIKAPAGNASNSSQKKTSDGKAKTPDPPARTTDPVASNHNKTTEPVQVVSASYAPLALKYSILQRMGNRFSEVDSDTEFHSGDRIRVRVETNSPAYLYIVMGGSSGQWQVLFPSKEIFGGDNRIEPGQGCTIPPDGDPPFYFDETAGVEKVSLVLTRSPEPDLEKLIYAVGDPSRRSEQQSKTIMAMNHPIDGAVMNHLRDELVSRDLVFEKFDGKTPEGKQEKAVYAATRDKSANAQLFVDLKLVHK
jgi:hypothetical protein